MTQMFIVRLCSWGKFMSIPWVYFWAGIISLPSFSKLLLLVTLHQSFPFYWKHGRDMEISYMNVELGTKKESVIVIKTPGF